MVTSSMKKVRGVRVWAELAARGAEKVWVAHRTPELALRTSEQEPCRSLGKSPGQKGQLQNLRCWRPLAVFEEGTSVCQKRREGRLKPSRTALQTKPCCNVTLCHLDWTEVKIRTKPSQKHDFEYWIKMDFCGRFKVLGSVRTSSSNTDRNSLSLSSAWSWVTRKEVTDTVTWRSWSSTTVYQVRPCPIVLPASIHTDSRLKGDWSSPIRTAPLCMMVTSLLRGVPGDSTHLPVYQLHPFSVPHLVLPSLPECQGLRFMLTFPCLCPPDTVRTGNCFSKD